MNQCVPSWDLDENFEPNQNLSGRKVALCAPSNSISSTIDVPTLDYEVAELTWKNGQLAMHGFGPRRVAHKPQPTTSTLTKYTWDKPRAAETLEAIVNQATLNPHHETQMNPNPNDVVPWLDRLTATMAAGGGVGGASTTPTMDALVPSSNDALGSKGVGSCVGEQVARDGDKAARGDDRNAPREWCSSREQSANGSVMESSRQKTWERGLGVKGLTSTSMGSPENTCSGKRSTKSTSADEHDSVCHSRSQKERSNVEEKKKGKGKSLISTRRSRAAAVHNQSERKRRDKINQKMKTLQKLVPNANKTDKASMLDEVIEYLKQLQAQINMMNRMNMSSLMMPLAMQQQLQMAMMNPMGMGIGMGMGMVMDLNSMNGGGRSNMPGVPSSAFHPSAFMQMPSWDHAHAGNDPMAAFLASQSQPMNMDAYSRMAAMLQQMQHQHCGPGLNN